MRSYRSLPVLFRRASHLRPEGARFSQPRATPSLMHTSRKPQCFNELQNRTNWSCSDRTFTISPIFRANGYLLKRPFKSRPRCVHQRGQRPGEPCRDTNAIGPTGQRFFLQSQPQATQVAYQRKRLARWAETCSALAYGSPGRCPGLGERRAFGPAKYRVSGKRTGMRRSHSDPRLWASFAQASMPVTAVRNLTSTSCHCHARP